MGRKRKAERQPKPLDSLGPPGVRMRLANATMVAHMLGRQTTRSGALIACLPVLLLGRLSGCNHKPPDSSSIKAGPQEHRQPFCAGDGASQAAMSVDRGGAALPKLEGL